MTFTAKAFIVCDLGRRGADLLWPTVMPFNTVINPDATTGTVGQGPPLATLPLPFFIPACCSQLCCSEGRGQGDEPGAPVLEAVAGSWAKPCAPPASWAGEVAPVQPWATRASPGPGPSC